MVSLHRTWRLETNSLLASIYIIVNTGSISSQKVLVLVYALMGKGLTFLEQKYILMWFQCCVTLGVDYSAPSATFTIGALSSQVLRITGQNDSIWEGDEDFRLSVRVSSATPQRNYWRTLLIRDSNSEWTPMEHVHLQCTW